LTHQPKIILLERCMDQVVQRVLRFGGFTLDLTRGCLRAGDRHIDLRPKAFEVLCYLARNAGRLVPKQELHEAVWPDVTVCDDSLVQCIRELRYKLGDDDRRLIKTVLRRGYLLDAAVSAQAPQSVSDGSAVQMSKAPQKLASEPRVPLRAFWPVATHKLRVWGAAALMPSLIAVVVTLGIDSGFFFTSWGSQSRTTELQSRADDDQASFDAARISELESARCKARYPDALARIPPPGSLSCKQEVMVLDGTCGPRQTTKIVGGCNLDSAGHWTQGSPRITSCVSC
jgi:DNA-binding winged helix-turn-helix (wHTH) protein